MNIGFDGLYGEYIRLRALTQIRMGNHMLKNMEHEMETGRICCGVRSPIVDGF